MADQKTAPEQAYSQFENKESRLLDHWYAPVVAKKAFDAGYEAGRSSSLSSKLPDRCGNCDHHSELHNIYGCTVRIQLEDGKTMVDCPCSWDNLQAASLSSKEAMREDEK